MLWDDPPVLLPSLTVSILPLTATMFLPVSAIHQIATLRHSLWYLLWCSLSLLRSARSLHDCQRNTGLFLAGDKDRDGVLAWGFESHVMDCEAEVHLQARLLLLNFYIKFSIHGSYLATIGIDYYNFDVFLGSEFCGTAFESHYELCDRVYGGKALRPYAVCGQRSPGC